MVNDGEGAGEQTRLSWCSYPLGDSAIVLLVEGAAKEERSRRTANLAAYLASVRRGWMLDIVPAYDTVTVVYSVDEVDRMMSASIHLEGERGTVAEEGDGGASEVGSRLYDYVEQQLNQLIQAHVVEVEPAARTVVIPVQYGGDRGPDLAEAAVNSCLTEEQFIALHTGAAYRVAMIGFMPGFPYLEGLPHELEQPRLSEPRLRVAAGSVGIAGGQTGVYPLDSPGGWQIIGHTTLQLFDPARAEPCLLRAGDCVRFEQVSLVSSSGAGGGNGAGSKLVAGVRGELEGGGPDCGAGRDRGVEPEGGAGPGRGVELDSVAEPDVGGAERISGAECSAGLLVTRPGMLTTVQDRGRNRRADGVSGGGAMDGWAASVANILVGNSEHMALLEVTLAGPALLAEKDMLIAVSGAYMAPSLNGEELPMWRPVLVKRGDVIDFGRSLSGCRAYLAVAGGIDVPAVLGSRSTDLRAGLGGYEGRRLLAGDPLPCPGAAPGSWAARWIAALGENAGRRHPATAAWYAPPPSHIYGGGSEQDGIISLRVMPGREHGQFSEAARERLCRERYKVAPASDRMGCRLDGPPLARLTRAELLSHGVVPGAVQVPPGGAPIILAADCQTTGGYPIIAHVASVDMPRLAQARPGDTIRFSPVSLGTAQRLLAERERELRLLAAGVRCRQPAHH
ncbi:5-oxoprolinase subunit PxpB [Paenibacillus sp. GCM10023252]|uniref:5-oxoprolinase subunit PxpB n=1 Tax=Paenibacillus sp. GCM10023252 TaxID=3252649 RepID=UPI0036074574